MDVQYGIAVTNKFALFIDEEEDPLEILRQKEEEKNAAPTKKDKKKSAKKSAATENKTKQQEQQLKKEDTSQPRQNGRGGRGGRGRDIRENDGGRPPRRQGPRDNRDYKGDENVPPEFRDKGGDAANRRDRDGNMGGFERGGRGNRTRGGRGRGRGGPRPESGRGNFGAPIGERRREFDRHSGTDRTGVKATDKRDGSGAHNWGSYRDDVEDQGQNPNPVDVSVDTPPAEQAENDLNESGEVAAPPKEDEEPKEMTLDEWKALQDQKRVKTQFNIRRAGEGVDSNQWKKGVAYKKKSLEEEEDEESEEEEEEEDRHGHRKQLVTDIRITFSDNPRRGGRGGRGPRGGRGGPRGGRGGFAGGDRPSKGGPRESAPRMDDETDFPRLVKLEA